MDKTKAFKVLDTRWQDLHIEQADGSKLRDRLYASVKIRSGYEFQRIYGFISWAGVRGELLIRFSREYIRIEKNDQIIKEDKKFHNRSSLKEKREYINIILERDPVVRRFATLIDNGDELILEIRKPKDTSDDE
jgi:hypothetical protein